MDLLGHKYLIGNRAVKTIPFSLEVFSQKSISYYVKYLVSDKMYFTGFNGVSGGSNKSGYAVGEEDLTNLYTCKGILNLYCSQNGLTASEYTIQDVRASSFQDLSYSTYKYNSGGSFVSCSPSNRANYILYGFRAVKAAQQTETFSRYYIGTYMSCVVSDHLYFGGISGGDSSTASYKAGVAMAEEDLTNLYSCKGILNRYCNSYGLTASDYTIQDVKAVYGNSISYYARKFNSGGSLVWCTTSNMANYILLGFRAVLM